MEHKDIIIDQFKAWEIQSIVRIFKIWCFDRGYHAGA